LQRFRRKSVRLKHVRCLEIQILVNHKGLHGLDPVDLEHPIILIDENFIHPFTRNMQFGKLNGTIVWFSNIVPLERKARVGFNNPKI